MAELPASCLFKHLLHINYSKLQIKASFHQLQFYLKLPFPAPVTSALFPVNVISMFYNYLKGHNNPVKCRSNTSLMFYLENYLYIFLYATP